MPDKSKPKIVMAISDPKLKDKVQINLTGPVDTIYWLIRFNIPLDESTVNEKSMEVTDTEGYIMRTDITYKADENRIIITPLDSYEEKRYYLLKVSTKVRSAKGQKLKSAINILFKLFEGQISNYKVLREDVPVPKSVPRPADYEEKQENRQPTYLDSYVDNVSKRSRMALDTVGINPILGILGLLMVVGGILIPNIPLVLAALVVCVLGAVHIYYQWRNKVFRSKIYYNRGVRQFNRMQYQHAKASFERALEVNPGNELAKYGLVRVGIYK